MDEEVKVIEQENKFELGDLVFEPAKEDDILPEGIWIPNRAQRRAMKKNKKKFKSSGFPMLDSVRGLTETDEFKQETYKYLAETIQKKRQEMIEKENDKNGTDS